MAVNRRELVKKQLRDRKGRWIKMGFKVKWKDKLGNQFHGTVEGFDGKSAKVRLYGKNGSDLKKSVNVAADRIEVINAKAVLHFDDNGQPVLDPHLDTPGKASTEYLAIDVPEGGFLVKDASGAPAKLTPVSDLKVGDEVYPVHGAAKSYNVTSASGKAVVPADSKAGLGKVTYVKPGAYAEIVPQQGGDPVYVSKAHSVLKRDEQIDEALFEAEDALREKTGNKDKVTWLDALRTEHPDYDGRLDDDADAPETPQESDGTPEDADDAPASQESPKYRPKSFSDAKFDEYSKDAPITRSLLDKLPAGSWVQPTHEGKPLDKEAFFKSEDGKSNRAWVRYTNGKRAGVDPAFRKRTPDNADAAATGSKYAIWTPKDADESDAPVEAPEQLPTEKADDAPVAKSSTVPGQKTLTEDEAKDLPVGSVVSNTYQKLTKTGDGVWTPTQTMNMPAPGYDATDADVADMFKKKIGFKLKSIGEGTTGVKPHGKFAPKPNTEQPKAKPVATSDYTVLPGQTFHSQFKFAKQGGTFTNASDLKVGDELYPLDTTGFEKGKTPYDRPQSTKSDTALISSIGDRGVAKVVEVGEDTVTIEDQKGDTHEIPRDAKAVVRTPESDEAIREAWRKSDKMLAKSGLGWLGEITLSPDWTAKHQPTELDATLPKPKSVNVDGIKAGDVLSFNNGDIEVESVKVNDDGSVDVKAHYADTGANKGHFDKFKPGDKADRLFQPGQFVAVRRPEKAPEQQAKAEDGVSLDEVKGYPLGTNVSGAYASFYKQGEDSWLQTAPASTSKEKVFRSDADVRKLINDPANDIKLKKLGDGTPLKTEVDDEPIVFAKDADGIKSEKQDEAPEAPADEEPISPDDEEQAPADEDVKAPTADEEIGFDIPTAPERVDITDNKVLHSVAKFVKKYAKGFSWKRIEDLPAGSVVRVKAKNPRNPALSVKVNVDGTYSAFVGKDFKKEFPKGHFSKVKDKVNASIYTEDVFEPEANPAPVDKDAPFTMNEDSGWSGDGYKAGYWGKYGASGVFVQTGEGEDAKFLIVQRGKGVSSNKGKWQLPGGALESNENAYQAAAREMWEELNVDPDIISSLKPNGSVVFDSGKDWKYSNLVAKTDAEFDVEVDGHETADAKWVTKAELQEMADNGELHGAFAANLSDIFDAAETGKDKVNKATEEEAEEFSNTANITPTGLSSKPVKIDKWKKVGGKSGSNPGGVFEDENGDRWMVKFPQTSDHARNEVLAANLTKLAGIEMVDMQLVDPGTGKLGVASPMLDISSNLKNKVTSDPEYKKKVQEGFALDAWIANWDVVGLDFDNIVTDNATGEPVRVDPGGALLYRAMGSPKGNAFGNKVGEWDTLRDGSNYNTAYVFGDMTDEQLAASAKLVEDITPDEIAEQVEAMGFDAATEDKLIDTLIARREDVIKRAAALKPAPAAEEPEPAAEEPVVEAKAPEMDSATKFLMVVNAPFGATVSGGEMGDVYFERGKNNQWFMKMVGKEDQKGSPATNIQVADALDNFGAVFNAAPKGDPDQIIPVDKLSEKERDQLAEPIKYKYTLETPGYTAFDGYNQIESESLMRFFETAHNMDLNKALRTDKGVAEFSLDIHAIDQVIARSPLTEDVTVWRGISANPEILSKLTDPEGASYFDKAFSSTSMNEGLAMSWVQWADDTPVVFKIELPKGFHAHAAGYSDLEEGMWSNEAEVILPRGLAFDIVNTEPYTTSTDTEGYRITLRPVLTDSNFTAGATDDEERAGEEQPAGDSAAEGVEVHDGTDSGAVPEPRGEGEAPAAPAAEDAGEPAGEVAPAAPDEENPFAGVKLVDKGKTTADSKGNTLKVGDIITHNKGKNGHAIVQIVLPSTDSVKVVYADGTVKVHKGNTVTLADAPAVARPEPTDVPELQPGEYFFDEGTGKAYIGAKDGTPLSVGDRITYTKAGQTKAGTVKAIYKGDNAVSIKWDDGSTSGIKKKASAVLKETSGEPEPDTTPEVVDAPETPEVREEPTPEVNEPENAEEPTADTQDEPSVGVSTHEDEDEPSEGISTYGEAQGAGASFEMPSLNALEAATDKYNISHGFFEPEAFDKLEPGDIIAITIDNSLTELFARLDNGNVARFDSNGNYAGESSSDYYRDEWFGDDEELSVTYFLPKDTYFTGPAEKGPKPYKDVTDEDIKNAPVGAHLYHIENGTTLLTKKGEDLWETSAGSQYPDSTVIDNKYGSFGEKYELRFPEVSETPEEPTSAPKLWSDVTEEDVKNAPVGSKMINPKTDIAVTKVAPNTWEHQYGARYSDSEISAAKGSSVAPSYEFQPAPSPAPAQKTWSELTEGEIKNAPVGSKLVNSKNGVTITKTAVNKWEHSQGGTYTSDQIVTYTDSALTKKYDFFPAEGSTETPATEPTPTTDAPEISDAAQNGAWDDSLVSVQMTMLPAAIKFEEAPLGTVVESTETKAKMVKTAENDWTIYGADGEMAKLGDGSPLTVTDAVLNSMKASAQHFYVTGVGSAEIAPSGTGDSNLSHLIGVKAYDINGLADIDWPVGTVFTNDYDHSYVKMANGWVVSAPGTDDHGASVSNADFADYVGGSGEDWTLTSVGDSANNIIPLKGAELGYHVGSLVNDMPPISMPHAPVGTTFENGNGQTFTKMQHNGWKMVVGTWEDDQYWTDSSVKGTITSPNSDYKLTSIEGPAPAAPSEVDDGTPFTEMDFNTFKNLPVGSTVKYTGSGVTGVYEKTDANGVWKFQPDGYSNPSSQPVISLNFEPLFGSDSAKDFTVHMPKADEGEAAEERGTVDDPHLQKGMKITEDYLNSLPAGSTVRRETGSGYSQWFYGVKQADGTWAVYKKTASTLKKVDDYSASSFMYKTSLGYSSSTAVVSTPKGDQNFVMGTGELGYVGDSVKYEGELYTVSKINKTGIVLSNDEGKVTAKASKLFGAANPLYAVKDTSQSDSGAYSYVVDPVLQKFSAFEKAEAAKKMADNFAGQSASEYDESGLTMPSTTPDLSKGIKAYAATPADTSNPLYGAPKPEKPADVDTSDLVKPGKWNSAEWLKAVEERYKANPNKAKETVQQSNKWGKIESVLNGDTQYLDDLLSSMYLDQKMYDDAKAGIAAGNDAYEAGMAEYNAKVKERTDEYNAAIAKYNAELQAWNEANPQAVTEPYVEVQMPATSTENFTGGAADWTKAHIGTHTAASVMSAMKDDNALGKHGLSFAVDSAQVENLDVKATKVIDTNGQQVFEFKFKVTGPNANKIGTDLSLRSGVSVTDTMYINVMHNDEATGLLKDSGEKKDTHHGKRYTYTDSETGAKVVFQSTGGELDLNSVNSTTTQNNSVRIRMPLSSTPEDFAKVLSGLGIENARPSTEGDIRVLAENRLLAMFGKKQGDFDPVNPNTNLSGSGRKAQLDEIAKEYGITLDDVVFRTESNGRVRFEVSDAAAQKLASRYKIDFFYHSLQHQDADSWVNVLSGTNPGLLSTYHRWNEGIGKNGMSSGQDMGNQAGDYVYLRGRSLQSTSLTNTGIYIKPSGIFKRLDFWANPSDHYGQRSTSQGSPYRLWDKSSSGYLNDSAEVMPHDTVAVKDFAHVTISDSYTRSTVIERLKAKGIYNINGIPVEDFIVESHGKVPNDMTSYI